MSKETIRPTEVQPFEEAHADEEVYLLDVSGVRFGFLYVTSRSSTLGWNGSLGFERLESEVLEHLSLRISAGQNWLNPNGQRTRDAVNVYFAIANEFSVECELKRLEDFSKYKDLLQKVHQISFVRYDVQDTSVTSPLVYSFTAENPHWLPTQDCELTIKLPTFQSWTAGLLEWVTEHHLAGSFLKEKVDLQDASATLSELSRSLKY